MPGPCAGAMAARGACSTIEVCSGPWCQGCPPYLRRVLRVISLPTVLVATASLAQWDVVPCPGMFGSSGFLGTMTGPMHGFRTTATYLSPSSGSLYSIYFTDSECADQQHVGGSGGGLGCCYVGRLDAGPGDAFYYDHVDQGAATLMIIEMVDGQPHYRSMGSLGGPGPIWGIANDSVCYLAIRDYDGMLVISRASGGSGFLPIDTLTQTGGLGPWVIRFNGVEHGA